MTVVAKSEVAEAPAGSVSPNPQNISHNGLLAIQHFEGCVLHPYDDGGRPGVGNATIGVGHLIHMGPTTEADRTHYASFTFTDAIALLQQDVQSAVKAIKSRGAHWHLTQPQFDALCSTVFNCGAGVLSGSIGTALDNNNHAAVPGLMAQWCHAGGQVVQGLLNRRRAEGEMFAHGTYPS
jgi:lysozyme